MQIRRELKSLTCLLISIQCLAASAVAGDRAGLQLRRSIFGPAENSPAARANLNAEAASVGAKGPALRTEIDSGVVVACSGRNDNSSLAAAITAARGGWIVIARGRTCAAGTITIPNLHIEDGGLLQVRAGETVTITEKFDAGVYQTFANAQTGQGTVSFSPNTSLREIYPQWWGAKGNGSNDDTQALNSAFSQPGQNVFVPKGSYKITANLVPPVCAGITGAGRDQTVFAPTAGVTYVLKVSSLTVILSNFEVDGTATSNATGIIFGDAKSIDAWGGQAVLLRTKNFKGPAGVGIRIADALKAEFSGILSDGNGIGLLAQGISGGLPTTITFRNSQFVYSQTKGVKLVDGHSLTFDGCLFESNREEGVFMLPTSGGTLENINFVNGCWFEDNYPADAGKYQFVAGDGSAINGGTIRPVLRDVFFAGSSRTAKAVSLSGPAVAGYVLDNVQVPNLPGEINITKGAYGVLRAAPNLEPSVVSKP